MGGVTGEAEVSPTLLIRRDPHTDYGYRFDTDTDGSIFVWVSHRTQLTDELLDAINDAYHHHLENLAGHPHGSADKAPPTALAEHITGDWANHPITPRTPHDDTRTGPDGQQPG